MWQEMAAVLLHDDYRATVCEHAFSSGINTKCHFNSVYRLHIIHISRPGDMLWLYMSHMTGCVSFLVDGSSYLQTHLHSFQSRTISLLTVAFYRVLHFFLLCFILYFTERDVKSQLYMSN